MRPKWRKVIQKLSRSLAQAYQETSWMPLFSTHPLATPTSLEEPSTFPVLLTMSYSVSGYKSNDFASYGEKCFLFFFWELLPFVYFHHLSFMAFISVFSDITVSMRTADLWIQITPNLSVYGKEYQIISKGPSWAKMEVQQHLFFCFLPVGSSLSCLPKS